VLNLLFAAILWFGDATIVNARSGSFLDRFYFSVQTMATIGYGYEYPGDALAHWIVVIESFVGIVSTAVITGLVFAKFGTTGAKVLWSNLAVIVTFTGIDDALATTVHARGAYAWDAIVWHRRFVDIIKSDPTTGNRYLDYASFHLTEADDAPRA
jgi:inward rectifier potassium channel